MVVDGAKFKDAAAATGISARGIECRFKTSGLVRRRRPRPGPKGQPEAVVRAALAMVASGALIKDAAAAVGMPASTLAVHVRRHGVIMVRPRKPRPGALTLEEREEIRIGIENDETDADIAKRLSRHRGTIGREIARNGGRSAYRAWSAEQRAVDEARRCRSRWFEHRPW